jgi:hypothetical protein
MITIEFTKEGRAISDFETEDFVRSVVDSMVTGDRSYMVSTSIVIGAILVAVKRREIPHDQVQFLFNGQIIEALKGGKIHRPPKGFGDLIDEQMKELLGF